ncbi:MAG TPA: flagellar basal body P-ring formation protein FlgA [Firmicutes bacterium]|jgi:flagella basal body P-ring formation protein FlgA|nr:flagellar basal body P-ring formation chaperone FlgA [Bacillota bacterium]HHT42203.1 flagellar basal body P-ring formation protein FlgA [Bacillota bacterium]
MISGGRLGVWALAALLVLLGSSAAWGAEPGKAVIVLPENATVQRAELLLGEIAEISGPAELVEQLAQISAGTSPQPGSSRNLTRGHIEVRLRHGGVDPRLVEFQGADSVRVFRVLPSAPEGTIQQEDGIPVYEVVVAARDLQRGEIIALSDLAVEEREPRGGRLDTRSPQDFVGLRTTRTILAGTPLSDLNVETVPLVERGDAVTLLVRTGNVVVTAQGIARQSGGLGDLIEVENALSKQKVLGEIIDANTVEVNVKEAGTP